MGTENNTAVATTREEKSVEFTPFGAQDKIKMNVAIVQKLIAVPTKSGKTCSEKEALRFIMMCQAKRLNPFEGDAYLIGYDSQDGPTFSLITAHQTYLKRAEINEEFDGMKSGIIVQDKDGKIADIEGDFYMEGDQTVVGGWATVFFKKRTIPTTRRVRLKTFQKSFGVWRDNSAGMICKCAEADALRSSFPTMLGGLYMKEEIADIETTAPKQASRPQFDGPDIGNAERKQTSKKSTVQVDTTQNDQPPQDDPDEADAGLAPKDDQGEGKKETTPQKTERDMKKPFHSVIALAKEAGIADAALVEWARSNKNEVGVNLASKTPKVIMEMREDSVKFILENWDELLPKIQQAAAKANENAD